MTVQTTGTISSRDVVIPNTTGAFAKGRRCLNHRRQWCWDNTMSSKEGSSNQFCGKVCPDCGDEFSSQAGMRIHWGQAHGPFLVECAYCGAEKGVSLSEVEEGKEYFCDTQCQYARYNEQSDGEAYTKVTVECGVCGDEQTKMASAAKRDEANICSPECERRHRGFGDPVQFDCDWCGQTDTEEAAEYRRYDHHFCSQSCRYKWASDHFTGENNPHYSGGNYVGGDPYGAGWTPEKKEAVRERDGRKCQHCGRGEEEHLEKFGIKHTIHHITPARCFEDPHERNAKENLITLCARPCHQIWESMAPLRPVVGGAE